MGKGKRRIKGTDEGAGGEDRSLRNEKEGGRGEGGGGKEMGARVTERVKEIERKLEWREREERRKNIIVRGVEVRKEREGGGKDSGNGRG